MKTLEQRVADLERRVAGMNRTLDRIDVLGNSNLHGQTILGTYPDNYAQFTNQGWLTLIGAATAWEDIRVEPTARTTGANAPSFEQWADNAGLGDTGVSRGVYLYSFDDAAINDRKEIFFNMQMPHSWAGTPIYLHVHWVGAVDDTTAAPRWGLEYTWKDYGETFGATETAIYTDGYNYTQTGTDANVTAGTHYKSKFAAITPGTTADGISSILICRLFRASDVDEDTYNAAGAKCGLLYIDAHYEVNSLGSNTELTKN